MKIFYILVDEKISSTISRQKFFIYWQMKIFHQFCSTNKKQHPGPVMLNKCSIKLFVTADWFHSKTMVSIWYTTQQLMLLQNMPKNIESCGSEFWALSVSVGSYIDQSALNKLLLGGNIQNNISLWSSTATPQ